MFKVLVYSGLLIAGLVGSQFLDTASSPAIKLATMATLAFIMIHVGYEFDLDKRRPRQYGWDYVVAATAAAFPWLFCALYFVFVMAPAELWTHPDLWRETLLESRFASPTSAGVLFAMLAAAGLGATWVFAKARILAIFDDLDTILLMIPLVFLMVGFRLQLLGLVALMVVLLWLAWRYLHAVRLPVSWPFVMGYAVLVTLLSEAVYLGSKLLDPSAPIHFEVLLPAFVIGCLLARPHGHAGDHTAPHGPGEQRAATLVSACFMVLVGLSMPAIQLSAEAAAPGGLAYEGASALALAEHKAFPGWGMIALHVAIITVLSNLGKMFPVFCYRREASLRQRLAVAICMFPRGEVGAGVLVISLSYGIGGPALTVATLSLALNLLCTGLFILAVKRLLATEDGHRLPREDRHEAPLGRGLVALGRDAERQ
jgi:hypothetical protein